MTCIFIYISSEPEEDTGQRQSDRGSLMQEWDNQAVNDLISGLRGGL